MDQNEETALLPRISAQSEQSLDFTTTWRGFRPTEVESYVARVETDLNDIRARASQLETSLAAAEARAAEAASEAATWRRRYEQSTPPFEELGHRVGEILALAEREAQSRREAAEKAAKKMLDDVERRSNETIAAAQERARELSSQADQDLKRREAEARERLDELQHEHDVLVRQLTEIRATLAQIPILQSVPARASAAPTESGSSAPAPDETVTESTSPKPAAESQLAQAEAVDVEPEKAGARPQTKRAG